VNIRVLLCDDHEIMRSSLRALIEKQRDLRLVGEAADGREAARLARPEYRDPWKFPEKYLV